MAALRVEEKRLCFVWTYLCSRAFAFALLRSNADFSLAALASRAFASEKRRRSWCSQADTEVERGMNVSSPHQSKHVLLHH